MATSVMASAASSLAFAATGARAGRVPARLPAAGLARRRRAPFVARAQAEKDAEKSAATTSGGPRTSSLSIQKFKMQSKMAVFYPLLTYIHLVIPLNSID